VTRSLEALGRRASGGFGVVESVHDRRRRRSCDASLCWCERSGVPAALRSRVPGEPPVAMGAIWMTEPDAPLGRLGRALAIRAARSAGAVWANSEEQLDVLARWGVPAARRHLVRLGVDTHFWRVDRSPERDVVVTAGNDRHRDHELAVAALETVRRRRPGLRLELVTRQRVRVPAALGVRRSSLSHPQLRALYARAAVVAVALRPNLHVSGSTVVLEAMACGRPVVVTRTPGMSAYVRDGETGLLVPPGDADAFAAAVEQLLADPERAAALGRAARAAVETSASSAAQAASLAAIVRTVV
jgi:glycosyltransferase involved in cell wall biosynthesis